MIQRMERQFSGRTLSLEIGRMARLAQGACLVQFGDTVALCAAALYAAKEVLDSQYQTAKANATNTYENTKDNLASALLVALEDCCEAVAEQRPLLHNPDGE